MLNIYHHFIKYKNRFKNLKKNIVDIYIFSNYCSALAIAEASKESYPDDESLSGSMLSLDHSNSSTSFPPNSL